jgi:hypothetical protein
MSAKYCIFGPLNLYLLSSYMSFSNVFVSFWCFSVLQVIDIRMQFKGGNKLKE